MTLSLLCELKEVNCSIEPGLLDQNDFLWNFGTERRVLSSACSIATSETGSKTQKLY